MQQRLNLSVLPHGQGSLRPSFSTSSLKPAYNLVAALDLRLGGEALPSLRHDLETARRRARTRSASRDTSFAMILTSDSVSTQTCAPHESGLSGE